MNKRFVWVVFGKAGSGKSTLTEKILSACPRPVLILDTMNDFNIGLQFNSAEQLRQYIIEGRPNKTGIYTLNATSDKDCDMFFRMLIVSEAQCTVVVDEASKFSSPHFIHPDLKQTIAYGRHWNQNLIFAARRAPEVHLDIRSQADVITSFKQTAENDIKRLQEIYPEADIVKDLNFEKHEFVCFGEMQRIPFSSILVNQPGYIPLDNRPGTSYIPDDPEPEDSESFEHQDSEVN